MYHKVSGNEMSQQDPSSPGSGNSHYENASSNPRPPMRPASPSQRSSSSILTMSKLYQQQQQQAGSAGQSGTLSPGGHPSHTHRLHSPKASSFLPKNNSNKKLHRRVLSGGSLKDDYFSTSGRSNKSNSGGASPSSNIEGASPQSPGAVKLPTFQRMENFTPPAGESEPVSTTAAAVAASQGQGGDSTHVSPNLSSSKIYDRRRAREKEFEDDANQNFKEEFMSNTDLADKPDQNDPDVDRQYKEKLENIKNEKAKRKKNVEFYNSDSGSDVDINSDNEDSSNATARDKDSATKLEKAERTNTGSSSTSSNSSENKAAKKLKSVFQKLVNPENYSSDSEDELKESEKNKPPDEGFFSKLVNLSGGGLAPGAAKSEQEKKDDEEAQNIIVSDEGTEMQTLDPELFAKEANGIVNAHSSRRSKPKTKPDNSDETTLKDNASINSHQGSFLAPNPDLYLRDEDGIFEMNLDDSGAGYIAPPDRVRGGVLSSLLKMYQNPQEASKSQQSLMTRSTGGSPITSGSTTPTEIHGDSKIDHQTLAGRLKNLGKRKVAIDDNNLNQQQDMIQKHRIESSVDLGTEGSNTPVGKSSKLKTLKNNVSNPHLPSFEKTRPKLKKGASGLMAKAKKEQTQARITVHIADILQRQRFVLRMCKALMLYGAPTHRLEEYLTMTARVLEIDGQFIYFPGCMIVSFGDATTRTSEVQLVRCPQGLNLYKLHRVHRIYKQVIHDLVGVEEASNDLDDLLSSKPAFPPWLCVLIYAFSSAMVTPFAFGGGWVNLPVSFLIGLCVGSLQFLIAPRSNLYSNVFEVTAAIVVAFVGRALGSISGSHICFSAVVQGSLALILPGYIILCGSLELQSRNLVAGAVRMFYAIIYSLFLGFGITLGAALYGWIDKNATSETTCAEQISPWYRFIFVPFFTIGLCLINQAKWFQLPVMLFISCAGYVVNFFASKHFQNSTEFTAAMGAFVIGVLGNLYSRIWKGLAVSAMLPAIFVQVPSGIASQASLLAGVQSANQLTTNSTSGAATAPAEGSSLSFGVTMVQVAIGISVGLFASTIFVYPFGKKSTSIFTL